MLVFDWVAFIDGLKHGFKEKKRRKERKNQVRSLILLQVSQLHLILILTCC